MSVAPLPPPCDRFVNNLLCMKAPILTAISQSHCKSTLISPDLVTGAFTIISFMDKQDLLNKFIERTQCNWELIATCGDDVAPVVENVLKGFQELGTELIDEILRVVKAKEVDIAVQKQILDLGRSLVRIAIRYLQQEGKEDVTEMAKLYKIQCP